MDPKPKTMYDTYSLCFNSHHVWFRTTVGEIRHTHLLFGLSVVDPRLLNTCHPLVVKTKHTFTFVQGSPSGCVCREIPGVTQVDEKGHEGNTAVVIAYTPEQYLCWRKHGQSNSTTGGVPADYYYSL